MLPTNRLVAAIATATLAVLLAPALTSSVCAAEKDPSKSKALELTLDSGAGVVLDADRNGMPAKTKLIPTPSFEGYSLSPVVDGIKERQELSPVEAAWASAEDETPHGIEIQFSQPRRSGRFQVTWAFDTNGDPNVRWWISRHYVIQVKANAGDDWKTVVEVKNNQSVVGSYPLPEAPFSFLRIYQLAGGGHAARPNLMWVAQLELAD